MESIIIICIIIFFIIAVICSAKLVTKNMMKSDTNIYKVYTVIPVTGKCNEIEYTVRSVLWSDNWNEFSRDKIILALDNCDDNTVTLCRNLCYSYNSVVMCSMENLADEIRKN